MENAMSRRTTLNILGLLLLAVAVSAITILLVSRGTLPSSGDKRINLKDRILKAGVIRVAYVNNAPGVIVNPNTRKVSGIAVDLLEDAAKSLGLKVEWTREVGWSSLIQEITEGRTDIGAYVWQNPTRSKVVDFSIPFFYNGTGIYVRADDHRFDNDLDALNRANIGFSATDGSLSMVIPAQDFPNAKVISLPEDSSVDQILLNVVDKKADATCADDYHAQDFLQKHPGTLRNITAGRPIRVFGNTLFFQQGEPEFKVMLDTAINESINSGVLDRLITKYQNATGVVYPVAFPYRQPTGPKQKQSK